MKDELLNILNLIDREKYPNIYAFYTEAANSNTVGGNKIAKIVTSNKYLLTQEILGECENNMSRIISRNKKEVRELLDIMDFFFGSQKNPKIKGFEKVRNLIYETEEYPIAEHLIYTLLYGIERKNTILELALKTSYSVSKILDVGIGPGVIFEELVKFFPRSQIDGIDVSSHCIRYVKKMIMGSNFENYRLLKVDIRDPIGIDNDYDLIIASEIIEHVEDPVSVLRLIFQSLKPGGRLVTGVPTNLPMSMHLFNFRDFEHTISIFQSVGFRLLEAKVYPLYGNSYDVSLNLIKEFV